MSSKFVLSIRSVALCTVMSVVVTSVTSYDEAWGQQTHSQAALAAKKKKKKAQKEIAEEVVSYHGGGKTIDLQKAKSSLPQSSRLQVPQVENRNLKAVKPPRSSDFYEGSSKEVEYEKLVDEEIRSLYSLSQQYKRSRSRGEIWLRLAERYVEKARLNEFRVQNEYDRKLKDFLEKRTAIKPNVDNRISREYNQKAVQLYEWFIRDFPTDKKIDQALFFLGYNYFELGDAQKGESYYLRLVKEFPESAYIVESYFALGEYYFENEDWQRALAAYTKVIKQKNPRLNAFALYKSSWCLYRLARVSVALKTLERVVVLSRAGEGKSQTVEGQKTVNKVRLGAEALKDYVPFYSESGDFQAAYDEFNRVSHDEAQSFKMLERLAYIYGDGGNKTGANYTFKKLISLKPTSEKAADFQYQVVLTYANGDQKDFRHELEIWLESFGPSSYWVKENAKNSKLIEDTAKLQEATLRNYVLQLHQTAQNSRAPYSQEQANVGYQIYLKYFPNSAQVVEMQFFHAELLFDMQKYEEAARLYRFVADHDAKGPYYEKAIVNTLLALEKDLPTSQQIDEKRGTSIEPIPLDPNVLRFEKAAIRYIATFPKGEKAVDVQRRLGVLYYSYNHFDQAIEIFDRIMRENPKSANAEIAGNLILDIYKLKGDMVGLTERGQQFLANPVIAKSKFGNELRTIMESASYKRADKLSESDPRKAAKEYEAFANNYKSSNLATPARYKAASAYEKAGDITSALRMHNVVLATPSNDPKIQVIQSDSRNALARLYQQTGQLELAAKQYANYAKQNGKDPKAINAYYNAAVLYDALGESVEAEQNYTNYFNLSKKADRIEVLYAQAEIARKNGNMGRAERLYNQYLDGGPRNQEHAAHATFIIASSAYQKGHAKKANQWFEKTIDLYKTNKRRGKEVGVKYAAEARFNMAQSVLQELAGVHFTASDKQQAKAATQIESLKKKYIDEMKDVLRFDHAPYIVAALASTGQMFEALAVKYSHIPVPRGLDGEDAKKYKELIQKQVDAARADARNSFKAAFDKSVELESFTNWTKIAMDGMGTSDSPVGNEITGVARTADWMGL